MEIKKTQGFDYKDGKIMPAMVLVESETLNDNDTAWLRDVAKQHTPPSKVFVTVGKGFARFDIFDYRETERKAVATVIDHIHEREMEKIQKIISNNENLEKFVQELKQHYEG